MPEQPKLFSEVFKEHLKGGTCAAGKLSSRWKDEAFADAAKCTVRALSYWKSGERAPSQAAFSRIVALFFGNDVSGTAARTFIAAWQRRKGDRSAPRRSAPPAASRGSQSGAGWTPEHPFVLREGLGRLYIHDQGDNQDAASGGTVALDVTAEAGRAYLRIPETGDTPRYDAAFAVTAAEIVVLRELNVTPVPRTTLGTPDKPHPGVTFASSWHLKVPAASDGEPGGIVLAGDTLRQYSTRAGQPYGIRLELRCRDIDLKPTGTPAPPDISEKQRAVLHRMLQRQDADLESGTIALARVELFRPSGE